MFTLELGVVTAGFLFMALACVGTAIFGRFFCGWACHIMVLQDACAWLLRKAGLRAKPIRSRLLAWVPFGVMVYMFVWPQLARMHEGRPFPILRFSTDTEAVASFATTNFWRNLPSPAITAITFLVCGFLAVYVLGSRGFCTYGCPYGAVFRLADRIAPGRIRVDPSRCVQCGTCTAVCTSGVRVHEETRNFGMVVNPRCMKDLDCVGACPEGALSFGFGRAAFAKGEPKGAPVLRLFDFTWGEEALMGIAFLATLLVFRGLYNRIPFLLTVGLGGVVAHLVVVLARLARRPEVVLAKSTLKRAGRPTAAGWAFAGAMVIFFALAAHSAFVQYHKWAGVRLFARAAGTLPAKRGELLSGSLSHLRTADRFGLIADGEIESMAGQILAHRGERAEAERRLRRALEVDPRAFVPRLSLSDLLLMRGAYEETETVLQDLLRVQPPGGIDPGPIRREAARRLAALPALREAAGSR